jgi:hypothetical protein
MARVLEVAARVLSPATQSSQPVRREMTGNGRDQTSAAVYSLHVASGRTKCLCEPHWFTATTTHQASPPITRAFWAALPVKLVGSTR